MSAVLVLLPFVLVVCGTLALVGAVLRGGDHTPADRAAIEGVLGHTRRWRVGALVAGAVVAGGLLALGDAALGLGPALAPAAAGTVIVAGVCVGELTVRPTRTATRTASPRARRVLDFLPRAPLALAVTTLTLLGGVLAVAALLGDSDDLGRAGRALTVTCGEVTASRGPWPGSFYALPIAVATLVSVALAGFTCRTIAVRPAPDAPSAAADTVLRRWSARTVLLSLALGATATLTPVLALMASAAAGLECAPNWYGALAAASALGAIVCAALTVVLLAALLTPPRISRGKALDPAAPIANGATR